jgi:hypothetical protein
MSRRFATIAILVAVSSAIAATPPSFSVKRLINTPIPGLLPFDVRTEDIDRDGDTDIYTANYSGRIAWYENNGGPGPWPEHVVTDFADGTESVFAARIDPDADIDIFYAAFNRDEIAWYENSGNNTTWEYRPITFDVILATDVWAADMDQDGDVDALSASGSDGKIVWYENTGPSGNSWLPRVVSPSAAECVEAADIDQDGDMDVVAGLSWHESTGGVPPTTFTPHLLAPGSTVVANSTAVLDVDRDGDPDIVTASQESDQVAWYENNGAAQVGWTLHVISTTADFATSVYGADLDGDGDLDLLSSSFFDNTIAWYENNGGSSPLFTRRTISTAAAGARSVFAADLDGDGDMDVLSATQNDQKVVWHVNDADYPDTDHDGVRDELDCAPQNATAFRAPREVSGVRFRSRTLMDWNTAIAGSGSGARYDVMQGALSQFPPGSGSAEFCLASHESARTLTDDTALAPGAGVYFLVRASNVCGTGDYGAGSSAPRGTGACPP